MDMNFVDSSGKNYTMPMETQHNNAVRHEITKNDHPHPTITSTIFVVLVLVLYLIYTLAIKPNFSGVWYHNGDIHVYHNAFTNALTINTPHVVLYGHAVGNALYVMVNTSVKRGIISGKKIYWIDGDIWSLPTRAL